MKTSINYFKPTMQKILPFLMLISLNCTICLTGTAQEQDTICRPVSEIKQLLIDSRKLPICDSLLNNRIEQIETLEDKIDIQQEQKDNLLEATEQQQGTINGLRNDLKKSKRKLSFLKGTSIVGAAGVAFLTIILIVTL